ncbi:MAG: hypothetical protein IT539_00505 [Bradyrhizobiaceae bacterium]|nr:hypothetical protein [Bradyrhizobiaceae bacterium]
MRMISGVLGVAALLTAGTAAAHHGWGTYDASKTVVLNGPILKSSYEFPHGEVEMEGEGGRWTVTLAPPSRMQTRGLSRDDLVVGKQIKAEGYPSTVRRNEMRAERVTVGTRVIEMR